MKKIHYILLICFVLCSWNCSQDNSWTDFKDLNKVTITGLKEKYTVVLYDYLKIPLDIVTTQNNESQLSYTWYIYTTITRDHADTISREKNLNVLIDPTHATPGEAYTLAVKVTDETTGVYYRKEMALEVLTEFTKGTILLCEQNNQAEVNFLSYGNPRELMENVYSRGNNGQLVGKNPLRVYALNPNEYAPAMKQVLVMCSDEDGGMAINPISFGAQKPLKNCLIYTFTAPVITSQLYYKGAMIDYLMINGKLHKRAVNMGELSWDSPLVVTQGPADYEATPYIIEVGGMPTFFDRKNKRLLQHYRFNMGSLHEIATTGGDLSKFDCNNFGENMEMVCCGYLSEKTSYWLLMRNSQNSKLFMYKFKISDSKFISTMKMEMNQTIAPNMDNAITFASNPDYPDILMYATKDQLYSLSLNLLNESTNSSLEAPQANLAARNMEITGMKFVTIKEETETPGQNRQSLQVRLFIIDGNQTTLKGGIAFYEISSEGGIHATSIFNKSGFCDKVIDIDEKYN